jgi:starch synthase
MAWGEGLLNEERARFDLPPRARPLTYARELKEYELADIIVVASQMAKRSFVSEGVDARKIKVVPYGVNFERFHRVEQPSSDNFEILFVGGLSLRKGAMDLFDAFEAANIANKRLTIIGRIDPQVSLLLRGRLTASNVNCLGHVPHDQLKIHMSRADVMAMPSIEDGFAMVVGEAMACGCPVIVSCNVGAADMVQDGENGFIVPIRAPKEISDRFEQLANDPARLDTMSDTASQSVKALGGWDTYGQTMMSIYTQSLADLNSFR